MNSPSQFQREKLCFQTTTNKLPGDMQNTPPAEKINSLFPYRLFS